MDPVVHPTLTVGDSATASVAAAEPFGCVGVGADAGTAGGNDTSAADAMVRAPLCRCGATSTRPSDPSRCVRGHVLTGHAGPRLDIGVRSQAFWAAHEAVRRELRDEVIRDAGFAADDAPRALQLAAETIAQAAIVRDAAYIRLAESGGPLAASGRVRRAFAVWGAAADRVERHLKLVGLQRKAPHVDALDAVHRAVRDANR